MTSTSENTTNSPSISIQMKHDTVPLTQIRMPRLVLKPVSEKALQHAMRAIDRTGQQLVPVLVDSDNVIMSGLEIFTAMKELGAEMIAIVKIEDLSPAEYKALTVLFAKLPELSAWDDMALAEILQDITIEDPDAIDLTGFEIAEIDVALKFDGELQQDTAEDEEAFSYGDVTISKPGDRFQLGMHCVYCGDSQVPEVFVQLLEGQKVAAVLTDPPYNIPIEGNVSGLGKAKHSDFAMAVGEKSFNEFSNFLENMLTLINRHVVAGALVYVFMDRKHLEELFSAARQAGYNIIDLAIWNKLRGGMGGLYRSQHEPCLVLKHGTHPSQNNTKLGKFGRNRSNVWDHPGYNQFGSDRQEALAMHPTVKPWKLLADIMMDCTARGEIVLDPFLGSGSTILAAEKTGRRCFGVEFEPKYVDIAIQRWEKMTGESAVHSASGMTFAELTLARNPTAKTACLPPSSASPGVDHGQ